MCRVLEALHGITAQSEEREGGRQAAPEAFQLDRTLSVSAAAQQDGQLAKNRYAGVRPVAESQTRAFDGIHQLRKQIDVRQPVSHDSCESVSGIPCDIPSLFSDGCEVPAAVLQPLGNLG